VAVTSGGALEADALTRLSGFSGAVYWGADAQIYAQALAAREGPILPLVTGQPGRADVLHEKHLCVDTTASGGNAVLLAG